MKLATKIIFTIPIALFLIAIWLIGANRLCLIKAGCPTIRQVARQLQSASKTGEDNGNGEGSDNEPPSESGKSAITLLLWSLSAISLLIFTCGLFCLTLRYPYIFTPIDFSIMVLFSVLAFRKHTKKDSRQKTANHNHPNTFCITFNKIKQSTRRYIIPRRSKNDNKDTKKPRQKANDRNDNKKGSPHNTPPREK
jgi:hypothetical protein